MSQNPTTMEYQSPALNEKKKKDLTDLEKVYGTLQDKLDKSYSILEEKTQQDFALREQRERLAHAEAVRDASKERQTANRQEYLGHELLQKYLPQLQAMQGTSGMGTSATDAITAYNAYLKRVSDNNAAYAGNIHALNVQKANTDAIRQQEKADADAERALQRTQTEADMWMKRLEQEKAIEDYYRDLREAEERTANDNLLSLIEGRASTKYGEDGYMSQKDFDELSSFVEQNKGRLTDLGKQTAEDMLEGYRDAIRDAEDQKYLDRNEYINIGVTYDGGLNDPGRIGNNFTVKDKAGNTYKVEVGRQETRDDVQQQASKAKEGEVFSYGGQLYIVIGSDVYQVNSRSGKNNKEKYNELEQLYWNSVQTSTAGSKEK